MGFGKRQLSILFSFLENDFKLMEKLQEGRRSRLLSGNSYLIRFVILLRCVCIVSFWTVESKFRQDAPLPLNTAVFPENENVL